MPYRRKDSPIWWVSYTDASGRRVRRSTDTADRKEAGLLEAKWKLEAHRQKQWDAEPVRTYDELMLAYLKATEAEKRSADRDAWIAKNLTRFFTGRVLTELRAVDIRAYIDMRRSESIKDSTICRELSLLSSAINYARREWEWDVPNPVMGRKPHQGEGRIRWIIRAEAANLIRAAESEKKAPHLPDFIELGLNTGCRKQEMLGLEWRRVDLQERLIYLEAENVKEGRRSSVPLNEAAYQAILSRARFRAQHCPGSSWVFCDEHGERIASIDTSFATACKRAGIADFHPHDLRHTCAAWLVQAGVPLAEIRDLLRHSTVQVTEKYAHLAPQNVRAAVAVLDGSGKVTIQSRRTEKEETEMG